MRFIPLIVFLVLGATLGVMLLAKSSPPGAAQTEVKPLPTLTLAALDGKAAWKQEHLQGQVTVLNFFASWCTPCIAELPELAALKKRFPALHIEGVVWNDEPDATRDVLKKNGNPFDVLWLDANGDTAISLGIRGIPETFIVDANGMVRYRLSAPLTPALMQDVIAPLIAELLSEAAHAK